VELIDHHWRDIEVLAAILRERGTMTGQGVRLALYWLHDHDRASDGGPLDRRAAEA
jgi:hypothetical protein